MDDIAVLRLVYCCTLGCFGLAIGSFLNVVAYRVPKGISLLHPPSTCPKCGRRIPARDNIPVLGWLLLRGKCRACHAPVSWRYPVVEAVTGALWAMEGWRLADLAPNLAGNTALGVLELAFLSSLVVTFLIDWDYTIILDEISLGGTAVALAASALLPVLHQAATPQQYRAFHPILAWYVGTEPAWLCGLAASGCGLLLGAGFSLFIYFAGSAAFKKQIEQARKVDAEIDSALGIGDIKLMAFYGALLGWQAVFAIFIIGSVSGAICGSAMKLADGSSGGKTGWAGLAERWRTGSSVIPFGPFLSLGALAAFAAQRLGGA